MDNSPGSGISHNTLRCVASTDPDGGGVFYTPNVDSEIPVEDAQKDSRRTSLEGQAASNYFKSAEWSPDGTTILTNSADNNIRSFVLPPDLLDDRPCPHRLTPYRTIPSTEPVYALAPYPYFDLSDTSTTIFLSSVRDHPIRLTSALYPGLIASYSLISPTTEAFITPHSILYPASLGGTHFLTGSDSLICLFDVSRPGKDGPTSTFNTIPSKRKKIVGGGIGMKGIVSAMADNPTGDGILAAGTYTRHVGLYSAHGSGETIANFCVADTEANRHIGGMGITQVLWSSCGRYLYVVERKSDGILAYDIRVTGKLVGWLGGRNAMTNQRMKADIFAGGDTGQQELWAGGTDGIIRVWTDPSDVSGGKQPTWEMRAHDDAVSSTVVHPMGSVVATCSGQKQYPPFDDDNNADCRLSTEQVDNNLTIWQL